MAVLGSNNTNSNTSSTKKNALASTQTHLNFAEVRDGIVIMRDGSLRMIIICSPTNYDLKSGGEKESIEYSYQGFLNGLHFPVQICIQSRKIDLDGYISKLEQMLADQSNPLLADLMEDYIYNIRDLLEVANIMDKRFFVIVPYNTADIAKSNIFKQLSAAFSGPRDVVQSDTEFNTRKTELIQRTNIVAQGLASVGVRTAVLSTQEVIELFYNSYNVDESESQTLTDTENLTAQFVSRDGGDPRPYNPPPKEQEPPDLFTASGQNQQQGGVK